jgi:hypothetical protein
MASGSPIADKPVDHGGKGESGLFSFTIFWKENACSALVRTRQLQATDLATAKEAAEFLIFRGSNTVAVVLGVVED